MKVGELVQNIGSKEVGVIIAKSRPQPRQIPFMYVLSGGKMDRWKVWSMEIVNESR